MNFFSDPIENTIGSHFRPSQREIGTSSEEFYYFGYSVPEGNTSKTDFLLAIRFFGHAVTASHRGPVSSKRPTRVPRRISVPPLHVSHRLHTTRSLAEAVATKHVPLAPPHTPYALKSVSAFNLFPPSRSLAEAVATKHVPLAPPHTPYALKSVSALNLALPA